MKLLLRVNDFTFCEPMILLKTDRRGIAGVDDNHRRADDNHTVNYADVDG